MPHRSEALAIELDKTVAKVIDLCATLSPEDWRRICPGEEWPVGMVAHHIATGIDLMCGHLREIAAGHDVKNTLAEYDAQNAAEARQHWDTTAAETMALLQLARARAMTFMRRLTDEELDRSAWNEVPRKRQTAEELAHRVSDHARHHLDSIRSAVSQAGITIDTPWTGDKDMTDDISGPTTTAIARVHGWLVATAGDLSDTQLTWRAGPMAPPIGFHLWHVSRLADRLQAKLPEMRGTGLGREVWEADGYADQWLVGSDRMGFAALGVGIDEDTSAQIPLVGKEPLVRYAQHAFEALDRVLEGLNDTDFGHRCPDLMYVPGRVPDRNVGEAIIRHLGHASRHLGMMEALKGVLGEHGSATP
jgi:hypothetical protein